MDEQMWCTSSSKSWSQIIQQKSAEDISILSDISEQKYLVYSWLPYSTYLYLDFHLDDTDILQKKMVEKVFLLK